MRNLFPRRRALVAQDVRSAPKYGAGNQVRTGDLNLGKVALYQLSYSRVLFWRFGILPPARRTIENKFPIGSASGYALRVGPSMAQRP